MIFSRSGLFRPVARVLFALVLAATAQGQPPPPPPLSAPLPYSADATSLLLAQRYLLGGSDSRVALLEALQRMGWGVRNAKGDILQAAPAGADTGLAMRDYELEELLWKPTEQPAIRLISVAQAMAVPFEGTDAEELAQDLLQTVRDSAESTQPQQRFWGRFILALSRVSPNSCDLASPGPSSILPLTNGETKAAEKLATTNLTAAMLKNRPTKPVWPDDDPVLAPSPRAARPTVGTLDRDRLRMDVLSDEMAKATAAIYDPDPAIAQAAQVKMATLTTETVLIAKRMESDASHEGAAKLRSMQGENVDPEPRFLAEWRDQPLSLLQVALISRVVSADLRRLASAGTKSAAHAGARLISRPLPFAMIQLAQVSAPAPTFGDQFGGAAGDIWANGWGNYTGAVLEHHLPDAKFTKSLGIANTIIAWLKAIMSVARQNITIDVENAPLVRTKTRTAGEVRTAHTKVEIDFPKGDALKAIRAAGNFTGIDLQLPDGGPASGAKIVWRLPEGSYGTKFQSANGGSVFKPGLAFVQFREGGGYVSTTNDAGEATIDIQGVPQRKDLSPTVRKYPRRAVVAIEVTIKVGNITQDFNDAISNALGGPIGGGLSFIADMILRTSFFFQKSQPFEVTDWKEPAWEGEFTIKVRGGGNDHSEGQKGGSGSNSGWSINRSMEGKLHTPEWDEDEQNDKMQASDGRFVLEVDGDTRRFSLHDSSFFHSKDVDNRYDARGPIQVPTPGPSNLIMDSRSEPSGFAALTFTGGKMILDLKPFFAADCMVVTSERSKNHSSSYSGVQLFSLLDGVTPGEFSIVKDNDGSGETIEGTETYNSRGTLAHGGGDVTVVVDYRLWKNVRPPAK